MSKRFGYGTDDYQALGLKLRVFPIICHQRGWPKRTDAAMAPRATKLDAPGGGSVESSSNWGKSTGILLAKQLNYRPYYRGKDKFRHARSGLFRSEDQFKGGN